MVFIPVHRNNESEKMNVNNMVKSARSKNKLAYILSISLLVFSFFSLSVSADQVYKWTDKNGVVHFGDAPRTHQVEQVDVEYNRRTDPYMENRKSTRSKMLNNYDKAQKANEENTKQASAGNDPTSAKCAKVKKQYESYTGAKALYAKEGGKKRLLSKEERASAIKEVKDYMDSWCK
jgi:hypothetical protein